MQYVDRDFCVSRFYTSKESKLFKNTSLSFLLSNKHGGKSRASFSSLNVAYHVGDNKKHVYHNRLMIVNHFFQNKTLLYLNQVHSNAIFSIHVDKHNQTKLRAILHTYDKHLRHSQEHSETFFTLPQNHDSRYSLQEILLGNADGIICNDKDFVVMSMVADCNPILIYDKDLQVFALLHAGRAGVCHKILSHALLLLIRDYKSKVQNLRIFIGASIRKCCYEIDSILAHDIKGEFGEQCLVESHGVYKLDMLALLQVELHDFAIKQEQVEISPFCSCCNEDYFSYRRQSKDNIKKTSMGNCGRFALFASLL